MKRTFILLLCFIAFAMACQDDNHPDENPMVESYVRDNFFNPNFISSNNEYIGNASTLKSSYTITVSDLDIEFRDQIMNYYQENLDFAQQVKDKVGLPVWDYTIYNTYDVDKLAFIPCARENSNYTEGVIIVLHNKAKDKLLFNYTDRYNFDAYLNPLVEIGYDKVPDRTYIMSLFLLFDKKLFNYVDCDILAELNHMLYSDNQTGTKNASLDEECRMELVETEIDHYVSTYAGGEWVKTYYSHSSREYNFEWVCRKIEGERQKLPWGNDDGSGGTPKPLPIPPVKASKEFLNNEKLKCIWHKINNISANHNNSLISSIFASFSDVSYNPQDIKIELGSGLTSSNGGVANGTTSKDDDGYIIKINQDNLSGRAPIEIYKTIVHEMIHAHLWRKQFISGDSFISRYHSYINFSKGVFVTDHHRLMKDYYIPIMANALREFDKLNGRSLDMSHYINLAWAGLHMNLPLKERQKIQNTLNFIRNRNLDCEN